jgi:hypothetical protein
MRSSGDFPCLDLSLEDTSQSERFLPWRGALWCAECPGSGFAGYDGYVGTGVWGRWLPERGEPRGVLVEGACSGQLRTVVG